MSFDAKSGIMKAISETNDPHMKTLLLLMLAVLEEIGGKVDSILRNEHALRQTVLNGHTDSHHDHHEWLERRIKRDDKVDLIIGWAENKIIKEREAEEDARKVKTDVVSKVMGYIAVAVVAGFLTWLRVKT